MDNRASLEYMQRVHLCPAHLASARSVPKSPPSLPPVKTMKLRVRVGFNNIALPGSTIQLLHIDVEPSDTVLQLKQKVAAAAGGLVSADDLQLTFGPNDRKIGRQYQGDPVVDESKLTIEKFSLLDWIQRFPHWTLTGKDGRRLSPRCSCGCPGASC